MGLKGGKFIGSKQIYGMVWLGGGLYLFWGRGIFIFREGRLKFGLREILGSHGLVGLLRSGITKVRVHWVQNGLGPLGSEAKGLRCHRVLGSWMTGV